jgi:hypothetical protein
VENMVFLQLLVYTPIQEGILNHICSTPIFFIHPHAPPFFPSCEHKWGRQGHKHVLKVLLKLGELFRDQEAIVNYHQLFFAIS